MDLRAVSIMSPISGGFRGREDHHSFAAFSLRALTTTMKDDAAIAAPAIIGDKSRPVAG